MKLNNNLIHKLTIQGIHNICIYIVMVKIAANLDYHVINFGTLNYFQIRAN